MIRLCMGMRTSLSTDPHTFTITEKEKERIKERRRKRRRKRRVIKRGKRGKKTRKTPQKWCASIVRSRVTL